jgi:hypothetical protein
MSIVQSDTQPTLPTISYVSWYRAAETTNLRIFPPNRFVYPPAEMQSTSGNKSFSCIGGCSGGEGGGGPESESKDVQRAFGGGGEGGGEGRPTKHEH